MVLNVTYTVTCTSNDAPTLIGISSQEYHVFNKADTVRAGTDYKCNVKMSVRAHNGTSVAGGSLGIVVVRTTPKSEEVPITTAEGKGEFPCNSLPILHSSFSRIPFCEIRS